MSDRKLWSLGFLFTPSFKHVLLLRKGRSLHTGLWNGVGGKLENSESYESSMVRECVEESGIQTQKTDWKRAAKIVGIDWSVGVFAMREPDDAPWPHSYMDATEVVASKFDTDKPVYVPVWNISLLDTAPYTAALIHMCLEKLKKPEMTPVVIQTYTY